MVLLKNDHPNRAGKLDCFDRGEKVVVVTEFSDIGVDRLDIFPGVFNPATSFSGKFLARLLPQVKELFTGKDVLDMACGCGILGIVCGVHGARSVIASDLCESAAKNAAHNGGIVGVPVEAVAGDLFEQIPEGKKFDFIIFNPPGFEGDGKSAIDRHYICTYNVIDSFYALAPRFLKKGGVVVSATSTLHDVQRSPRTLAEKYGYQHCLISTKKSEQGEQYGYKVLPQVQ